MYAEISAAVASAKTALEIAKAAHGLSNYNELVAAVSEVNAKLMEATVIALASLEKQSALTNEIAEIKEKLRKLERFERETERYILEQLPFGGFAFALKKGMENGQPPHYLCATCMNKGEITILQPEGDLFLSCSFGHIRVQVKNPEMGGLEPDDY
jgi:hypothetical protein